MIDYLRRFFNRPRRKSSEVENMVAVLEKEKRRLNTAVSTLSEKVIVMSVDRRYGPKTELDELAADAIRALERKGR